MSEIRTRPEELSLVGSLTAAEHLVVLGGVSALYRHHIIEQSRQTHIVQSTPRDAAERFTDNEAFASWYDQGKNLYLLTTRKNGDLAGIIWYGQAALPLESPPGSVAANYTFAVRLYEGYNGHGLAQPFMKDTLRHWYESSKTGEQPPVTGLWLQTGVDNLPAQKTFSGFGFEEVQRDEERITMLLSLEQIQRICSAGD